MASTPASFTWSMTSTSVPVADCLSAMMTTLARYHGEDWSESLARQWKEAIELAIEEMMEGYQAG